MLVQEIKELFDELRIGTATATDVEMIFIKLGYDIRPQLALLDLELESRPMFIASAYRLMLHGMGFSEDDIKRMLPPEVSGQLIISDLRLGTIKLGTDYVGVDGTTIIPVLPER